MRRRDLDDAGALGRAATSQATDWVARRSAASAAGAILRAAALGLVVIGLGHSTALGDTTWPAGSTQFVNSTLTISNLTLFIEPGVTVLVSPGASIIVSGTGGLVVDGTTDDEVLLTVNGAGRWNGIVFQAGSEGSMHNAVIEKVSGTGIVIASSSPLIESCTVRDVLGTGGFARGIHISGTAQPLILRCTVESVLGNVGTNGGTGSAGAAGPDGSGGTFFSPNGGTGGPGVNGGTGIAGGVGGAAIGIDVTDTARPGIASTRVDQITGGKGGNGGLGGTGGLGGDGGVPVDGIFPGNGGNAGKGGNGGSGGVGGAGGLANGVRVASAGDTVAYQNIVARITAGTGGNGGNGRAGAIGGGGGPGIAFSLTPAFNTDGGDGGNGGNSGSGGNGGAGGVARLFDSVSGGTATRLVQSTMAEAKGGVGGAGGFASVSPGPGGAGGPATPPGAPGSSGSPGSVGTSGTVGAAGVREGARVVTNSSLAMENSILALGGTPAGTALVAAGSGSITSSASCLSGFSAVSSGNVTLQAGTILVDPQFVDPAMGNFALAATSPCIDAGSTAVVPYRRVATSFFGTAESAEAAAYDEFVAGIPGAGGCLVPPPLPYALELEAGTMTLLGLTAGGAPSCTIVDGGSGAQHADGALNNGTAVLRVTFDPPVRGFYSYFGSVAVGATPRMRVFDGATMIADINGAASPAAALATGLGVSRLGATFDRVDLSVNGDAESVAGAFAGLAAGEPSLGTVTLFGYGGPTGSTVAHDFAVDFDDGNLRDADGLPRLVDGSGSGVGPLDIGALEYQLGTRNTPCPADLNGDGIVDGADLGILLTAWGLSGPGDLSEDGIVNGADLGLLLNSVGPCPR